LAIRISPKGSASCFAIGLCLFFLAVSAPRVFPSLTFPARAASLLQGKHRLSREFPFLSYFCERLSVFFGVQALFLLITRQHEFFPMLSLFDAFFFASLALDTQGVHIFFSSRKFCFLFSWTNGTYSPIRAGPFLSPVQAS